MPGSSAEVAKAPTLGKELGQLRWWFIGGPLFVMMLISQVDKQSMSVIMSNKQFLRDLGLIGRPAVTGLLMSGFLLSYAIFQFFWGWFVKRYGPRTSAIIGLIIWGATLIMSGLAKSAGALITARVILGVGEAFTYPVCNTFVANWFPVKERARVLSIWLNGTSVAGVVTGALVVAVLSVGGWRSVFYTLAAISLLLPLPLVIFLMRDRPRQHPKMTEAEVQYIEAGSWAKTKEIPKTRETSYLRNYRFWLIILAYGFQNMFYWGWATWMPTYFQTYRHFSFKSAGYLYSLSFLFTIASVLIVGYFSDRIMRRAPFGAWGWISAGILTFLGGLVISNNVWAFTALALALCGQTSSFIMLHGLLHSIMPEGSISTASGTVVGLSQAMGVISPTLVGFLLSISGFGSVITFVSMSAVCAGLCCAVLARQGY